MNIQPKDTSRGHFYVSMIKSILRMLGAISFIIVGFKWNMIFVLVGGVWFLLAEICGVVEELV